MTTHEEAIKLDELRAVQYIKRFEDDPNTNAFIDPGATDDSVALAQKMTELLPHGSGINCDWTLHIYSGRVTAHNSYHCMDEYGGYDGWADFWISVPTSSPKTFALHFSGREAQRLNRKYALREYLEDEMYYALEELWSETK